MILNLISATRKLATEMISEFCRVLKPIKERINIHAYIRQTQPSRRRTLIAYRSNGNLELSGDVNQPIQKPPLRFVQVLGYPTFVHIGTHGEYLLQRQRVCIEIWRCASLSLLMGGPVLKKIRNFSRNISFHGQTMRFRKVTGPGKTQLRQ